MGSDDEEKFCWKTGRLADDVVHGGELGRETCDDGVEQSGLGGVEGHLDEQRRTTLGLYKYCRYPRS